MAMVDEYVVFWFTSNGVKPVPVLGFLLNLRILQEDLEQVEYELDSTQQHLGGIHFSWFL